MGAALRDEIESVLDDAATETETVESEVTEQVTEQTSEEVTQETQQPETTQAQEETQEEQKEPEKLHPLNHWDHKTRDYFNSLSREHQEGFMDRERFYSNKVREAQTESSQNKQLVQAYMQTLSPLVQGWQMRGIQPGQGLQMLVAREQAMREKPQDILLQLAEEFGVNLQEALQDAPFVDPTVKKLQDELRSLKEDSQRRQNESQQAQFQQDTRRQQEAYSAFESFTQETDESGALKYPYAANEDFMNRMAAALESRHAATLDQAYQMVEQQFLSHPFYKAQLDQVVGNKVQQTQAEVNKAKQAAQTVEGDSQDTTTTPQSLRADIFDVLEEAGYHT